MAIGYQHCLYAGLGALTYFRYHVFLCMSKMKLERPYFVLYAKCKVLWDSLYVQDLEASYLLSQVAYDQSYILYANT